MIVIVNSGPLMALGKLGMLELLPRLYGQVKLPTAVFTEVVAQGSERGYSDAFLVQLAIQRGHLSVVEVSDVELPSDIAPLPLDLGEKQTLYLALRDKADLVLFDDLRVREEAQARGLPVKGTLGVLIQAYRKGLLNLFEVQAIVNTIIVRGDIWISEELCRKVLSRLKTVSQK